MSNTADNRIHFSRRETLQTVGAAAALAVGTTAASRPREAQAPSTTVDASARNETGFWPNNARLAVSLSLMFEAAASRSRGLAA